MPPLTTTTTTTPPPLFQLLRALTALSWELAAHAPPPFEAPIAHQSNGGGGGGGGGGVHRLSHPVPSRPRLSPPKDTSAGSPTRQPGHAGRTAGNRPQSAAQRTAPRTAPLASAPRGKVAGPAGGGDGGAGGLDESFARVDGEGGGGQEMEAQTPLLAHVSSEDRDGGGGSYGALL